MNWHVVHTKPRQEHRALENLAQQGYHCFLPLLAVERVRAGKLRVESEIYFPRYLFIQLHDGRSDTGQKVQSWGPIRSTLGVSSLVRFGDTPARVPDEIIKLLRSTAANDENAAPRALFNPGDKVHVLDGPFIGMEGTFEHMTKEINGEVRAMVLIELLSKMTHLPVGPGSLRKV